MNFYSSTDFYSADDICKCSYARLFYSDEYLGYNHERFLKNLYPEKLLKAAEFCWQYVDARATGKYQDEIKNLWIEARSVFINKIKHLL